MGGHLQLRGKVLELQFVRNGSRRTSQDFHGFQALLANLRALTLHIFDQRLRRTLEEIAELLLGRLQSIQHAVQNTRFLAIAFPWVAGQQERATKGPTGQQEGLMDLHEKSCADQPLDCLCGFAVLLVGSRNLLDLVEHGIQLALIG